MPTLPGRAAEGVAVIMGPAPGETMKRCVRCGVPFSLARIECPEGRDGCLVIHYGQRCPQCGGGVYE